MFHPLLYANIVNILWVNLQFCSLWTRPNFLHTHCCAPGNHSVNLTFEAMSFYYIIRHFINFLLSVTDSYTTCMLFNPKLIEKNSVHVQEFSRHASLHGSHQT